MWWGVPHHILFMIVTERRSASMTGEEVAVALEKCKQEINTFYVRMD